MSFSGIGEDPAGSVLIELLKDALQLFIRLQNIFQGQSTINEFIINNRVDGKVFDESLNGQSVILVEASSQHAALLHRQLQVLGEEEFDSPSHQVTNSAAVGIKRVVEVEEENGMFWGS